MKKIAISILALFIGYNLFAQVPTPDKSIHELIQNETDVIYDSLVKIRRDFYSYPELSEHELRTSKKIASYLKTLGLDVKTNIGGHEVVGILEGENEGKHIAWCADIDALPLKLKEELSNTEFSNQLTAIYFEKSTLQFITIQRLLLKHFSQ